MRTKQKTRKSKRKRLRLTKQLVAVMVVGALVPTLVAGTVLFALRPRNRNVPLVVANTVLSNVDASKSGVSKASEQDSKSTKTPTSTKPPSPQEVKVGGTSSSSTDAPVNASTVQQTDPSLILWYPLSDVSGGFVADSTTDSQVYTGALVNFPTTATYMTGPGNKGRALVFNRAAQQRIDTPTHNLTIAKFTFAAWAYISEDDTPENNWEVGERGGGFWLNVRNSSQGHILRLGLFAGGWERSNMYQADSVAAVPRNQWVHLAGSFDGSTMRVYINGQLAGSRTGITGALYQPVPSSGFAGEPLRIGAKLTTTSVAPGQNWWQGALSDVRLYDRALSDTEISGLTVIN